MASYTHGKCYCGKITFKVALPVHWFGVCGCTQCQKIHGSSFAAWVGFKTDDFEIKDPEKNFTIYNTGRADRGFCKNCGTSFYFKYTDITHLAKNGTAVFFTPSTLQEDLHLHLDQRVYCDELPEWMDRYGETPTSSGSGIE